MSVFVKHPNKIRNFTDLSGKRFGRWQVVKRVENNQWSQVMYLCHCQCGWEAKILARTLKSGESKSCGCLRDEMNKLRFSGEKN